MRSRIRIFGVVSWLCMFGATAHSAEPFWTWVKGSSTFNQPGVYGTLRVGAPANTPGARVGVASWKDKSGRLWIFGGYGYDASGKKGYCDDLWCFGPAAGNWTWVKGGSSIDQPAVYGTQGQADPANTPGSRADAAAWTDPAGRLWLYGGSFTKIIPGPDYLSYEYNDLWCFDPATKNWTWVKGSIKPNQYGVYGTQGLADPANTPGARWAAMTWTDNAGRFWLFSGVTRVPHTPHIGSGPTDIMCVINDLWRFDPASGNWTWMKGSSSTGDPSTFYSVPSVYGVKGVAAPDNTPGSRTGASCWTDKSGRFWLFGGRGIGPDGHRGYSSYWLNDLWCFDPATNNWTWVKGTNILGAAGIYGTRGVAAPDNMPGARDYASAWTDNTGRFWLYGGCILGSSAPINESPPLIYFSDLWCFDPVSTNWTWVKGSQQCEEPAAYGVRGQAAAANTPGAREGSICWADSYGCFWLFGGDRYEVSHYFNDLWMITRPNAAQGEAWAQYP